MTIENSSVLAAPFQSVDNRLAASFRERPVLAFQLHCGSRSPGEVWHDRWQPAAGEHPCKNEDNHYDNQAKQYFFSRAHVPDLSGVVRFFGLSSFDRR
jgi:hypothetical protein